MASTTFPTPNSPAATAAAAGGHEPAVVVKGTWATAKQSFRDLFRWQQRVVITNSQGETYEEWQNPPPLQNPFKLFALLSAKQWLYFFVGFYAWTADAFDFHALSIQTTKLAKYYDRSKTDITTAITLTLLLRSVGAAVFGLLGDRFGRKWPMIFNMIILGKSSLMRTCYIKYIRITNMYLDNRSSSDRHHLRDDVPTVPGCPIPLRTLHGRVSYSSP